MQNVEVNCYSCGSKEHTFYDSENGYTLVKCLNCGLLYVNPRPAIEDISKAIITGEHVGNLKVNLTGRYHKNLSGKYLKILTDFFPNGPNDLINKKWLDIGCGFGEFIEAILLFTNGNINIKGCEPNSSKAASARKRKLNVDFFDLDNHFESYDFISLLNVFSHIPDPVVYLTSLKKNLNPNGEILLQTGHSSHLPAKYHSKPYLLPDHLSFANKDIVESIFRKIGFEVLQTKIYVYNNRFNLGRIAKEIVKFMLGRRTSLKGLINNKPYNDLFIRCRLAN